MNKKKNENLVRVLTLARKLDSLADVGDLRQEDVGCAILFGTMRDCAYKIRALAEAEIAEHAR